ncbi:hypothetical protein HID58_072287, partial [Brassica napus]
SREWVDQRIDPESNHVSEVFLGGIDAFIQFVCNRADYKERETLLCPCARCKNVKQREARVVARHLFLYGFKGNYYVWTSHGEKFYDVGESSGANHSTGEEEMWENPIWNAYEDHHQNIPEVQEDIAPPYMLISGQCSTGWLNDEDNTVLQIFMMLNCKTFDPYERMFEEYMMRSIPDITPAAMQKAKDTKFAEWGKDYVSFYFYIIKVSDEPCFISYPRVRRHSADDWWACAKIIPRGIRETSEIALTAWQDDRSDQVAESSLLRVETHVVDDVSDYDIASVNPPNDEYVSDVEMNSTIVPGTHDASPHMPPGATGPALNHAGSLPMPPGATGPALNHTASSSRSNSYTQMTLNAMLNSPTSLAQPHLHPDKLNGALWFGIDPSINAFIRATWQGYYMGPWKSWRKVPEERKDSWWQTFVQNFYWESQFNDLVYGLWKKETWTTIASGSGEPPSYTALVRETHSRPDGTFVDYRAEELVTQAEMEATQLSNTEGSPGSPSASSAPSRLMLNKAYLKNAKSKRGYVYGLGSEQYREHAPSSCVPNGLARNLELEMRVGGLETSLQNVTADVAGVKQDVAGVKQDVSDMRQEFAAKREAINQVLQTLRPPQAPTGQTSDQP